MSGWIAVEDRMPDDGVLVLASGFKSEKFGGGRWIEPVIHEEYCFRPLTIDDQCMYVADLESEMINVTHWMPLPEPPQ